MRGLGLLILRLAVGTVFMAYGLPKLLAALGSSSSQAAAGLDGTGVSFAYALSVATGIIEVLGGALLLAGAYTAWVSLLLVATTAATSRLLYLSNGFFLNRSLESRVGLGY